MNNVFFDQEAHPRINPPVVSGVSPQPGDSLVNAPVSKTTRQPPAPTARPTKSPKPAPSTAPGLFSVGDPESSAAATLRMLTKGGLVTADAIRNNGMLAPVQGFNAAANGVGNTITGPIAHSLLNAATGIGHLATLGLFGQSGYDRLVGDSSGKASKPTPELSHRLDQAFAPQQGNSDLALAKAFQQHLRPSDPALNTSEANSSRSPDAQGSTDNNGQLGVQFGRNSIRGEALTPEVRARILDTLANNRQVNTFNTQNLIDNTRLNTLRQINAAVDRGDISADEGSALYNQYTTENALRDAQGSAQQNGILDNPQLLSLLASAALGTGPEAAMAQQILGPLLSNQNTHEQTGQRRDAANAANAVARGNLAVNQQNADTQRLSARRAAKAKQQDEIRKNLDLIKSTFPTQGKFGASGIKDYQKFLRAATTDPRFQALVSSPQGAGFALDAYLNNLAKAHPTGFASLYQNDYTFPGLGSFRTPLANNQ